MFPVVSLTAASRMTFFTPPLDVQTIILTLASEAVKDISEMQSLDYVPESIPSVSF